MPVKVNEHIIKVTKKWGKTSELYCVSENNFAGDVNIIFMPEIIKLCYR